MVTLPLSRAAGQPSNPQDDDAWRAQALLFRGRRQTLLATSMANADTPGFQATDMRFEDVLDRTSRSSLGAPTLATTSSSHLQGKETTAWRGTLDLAGYVQPTQPRLDGGNVDMDRERAMSAKNLVLYRAALMTFGEEFKDFKEASAPPPISSVPSRR